MKRLMVLITLVMGFACAPAARAQTQEATQLILNYQKLIQLKQILDKMYEGYRILTKGYNTIRDIAEGNFDLHRVFLDGLFAVSPAVRNYKKVADIIAYQKRLVDRYRSAYGRFQNDPNLTAGELVYIERVFERLVSESLNNLEELLMVVTASKMRMNDEERLRAIDRIFAQMERKLVFANLFVGNTQSLAVGRAKEAGDVSTLRKLYGINE